MSLAIVDRLLYLSKRLIQIFRQDGVRTVVTKSVLFVLGPVIDTVYNLFQLFLVSVSLFVTERDDSWVFSSKYGFFENPKYLFLYVANHVSEIDAVWISTDRRLVKLLQEEGYNAAYLWSLSGIIAQLRSGFAFTAHSMGNLHWGAFYLHSVRTYMRHGHKIIGNLREKRSYDSWWKSRESEFDYVLLSGSQKPPELLPGWYQNTTPLVEGYPKNDAFFEPITGEAIGCNTAAIDDIERRSAEEQLIFYVPTKIGSDATNPLIDSERHIHELNHSLREMDAHLYVKLHPNDIHRFTDIDVSLNNITVLRSNIDLYPLLRFCDIFISDYSSVIVDAHLLDVPLIYFPYDMADEGPEAEFDRYGYTRRGPLAVDYSDIFRGRTVTDTDGLIEAIGHSLDEPSAYADNRDRVRHMYFDHADGNSSERIADFFLDEISDE